MERCSRPDALGQCLPVSPSENVSCWPTVVLTQEQRPSAEAVDTGSQSQPSACTVRGKRRRRKREESSVGQTLIRLGCGIQWDAHTLRLSDVYHSGVTYGPRDAEVGAELRPHAGTLPALCACLPCLLVHAWGSGGSRLSLALAEPWNSPRLPAPGLSPWCLW